MLKRLTFPPFWCDFLQVNFSEPLSMLQRLTEELEYSEILDQAALCEDSCEQLAYVAAFTVSAYATTLFRTGKPFNPLLGETFEFDRTEDFGWRSLAEQVSGRWLAVVSRAGEWSWCFAVTFEMGAGHLQRNWSWKNVGTEKASYSYCLDVTGWPLMLVDRALFQVSWFLAIAWQWWGEGVVLV